MRISAVGVLSGRVVLFGVPRIVLVMWGAGAGLSVVGVFSKHIEKYGRCKLKGKQNRMMYDAGEGPRPDSAPCGVCKTKREQECAWFKGVPREDSAQYSLGSAKLKHKQKHAQGPTEDRVPCGSAKLKHTCKRVWGPRGDSVPCGFL